MYDLDKDGYISLDDLTDILQHTTRGHTDPIRVRMIAASLLQVLSWKYCVNWTASLDFELLTSVLTYSVTSVSSGK